MNRRELKENAKRQISGKTGSLFLCGMISGIPASLVANNLTQKINILNIINNNLSPAHHFSNINLNLIFSLDSLIWLTLIISPILCFSLTKIYLKVSRDQNFTLKDFFKGIINSNPMDKVIWLDILKAIFTFLWSLLFIIPGIVKNYSYSMAVYILADDSSMKAKEALAESQRIMMGHKWQLFILDLSFIWWNLLIIITFGIASIYVVPYTEATRANFYNYLKKEQ